MSKEKCEKINIMTLGNSSVGKTSFIWKYTENRFNEYLLATNGFDIKTKIFKAANKKEYSINFFDTAGQEKYRAISLNVIKNADGILLMYDLTNKESFQAITTWMDGVKKEKGEDFPIILVGNKSDKEGRQVTREEEEKLANEYNVSFFETSNKTGENINEASLNLINKTIEKYEKDKLSGNIKENIKLNKKTSKMKNKKSCKKCG